MRLHDVVEGWGAGQPENLVTLLDHPYEELDAKSRALRAMAVELVHSFERSPVNTARDALTLIEKHHIPVRKGLWTLIALNAARERVYVRSARGMRLLHTTGRNVPALPELSEKVPLPEDGRFLAVYGGGPDGPSDRDVVRLKEIASAGQLVDILFWDVSEAPAAFYSARAQVESRGSGQLEHRAAGRLEVW